MNRFDRRGGFDRSREQRNQTQHSTYKHIPKFEKMTLECEILSPVHIGTGEEIPVYEYIISDGLLFKINLDKTIWFLSPEELSRFNNFNDKGNYTGLRSFLAEKYNDRKFRDTVTEFAIPVTREVEEIYNEKIGETENQLLIKLNQRNPLTNQPILPGSSIKGSIRTALLQYLDKNSDKKINGNAGKIEGELLSSLNRREDGVDPTRDPFKHLKIEDVVLPNNTTFISKVKNGIKGEDEFFTVDIQMIHEVTNSLLSDQSVKFTFDMILSSEFKIFNRMPPSTIDSKTLIDACRSYYRDRLEKIEGSYFVNTPIQSEINKIHNAVDYSKGEFLLRVGRFSGKMSVTLDAHRVGEDPKSRNLADGKYPMGWIKCKVKA